MAGTTGSSQAIRELTEQIEARKRQQQLVRDVRQQKQASLQRRHTFERLTAPILFLLTVLISAVVLLLF